jgi:signal transduction histidine kinase
MPRWIEKIVDYGGSPRTVRVVAGILMLLMVALGLLQYHWIGQLSEAKKSEMEQALRMSALRFSSEFNRDLARIYSNILSNRPFSKADSIERHAERYRQWAATALHPRLVKGLLMIDGGKLLLLDSDSGEYEPADWTPQLMELREELKQAQARERMFRGGGGQAPPPSAASPSSSRPAAGDAPPREGLRLFWGAGVSETIPAVFAARMDWGAEGEPPELLGWSIVELDLDYIQTVLLPDLAHRHFGENYRLRIVSRADPGKQVFVSRQSESVSFNVPDLEVGMFELSPQDMNRFGQGRDRGGKQGKEPLRRGPGGGGGGGPGGPGGGPPRGGGGGGDDAVAAFGRQGRWLLQLKHESGSLESAVQSLRYKNLGIISGILLLMGLTIAAFVASTRRAQQLAQQQMEFVAGISHELRTPLTVICSAGDNLAGGVVKNDAQVKRYGTLIRNEGRRLADMVEQILGYAGIQKGRLPAPQPVEVEGMIDSAFRASEQVLRSKTCEIDQKVAPGLPCIMGDAASLAHCVQNLITNAVKYGGDTPWIGVYADAVGDGSRVRIRVEDHGPGIDTGDLRHIFEPFYRGRKAVDDQIHGTGLGLSLVKRIVEAHNGKVSVESTLGQGSRFTLELPAALPEKSPELRSQHNAAAAQVTGPETNLT